MHSNRADRNAADVAERCRELSARPSRTFQKEPKTSARGDTEPDDARTCSCVSIERAEMECPYGRRDR